MEVSVEPKEIKPAKVTVVMEEREARIISNTLRRAVSNLRMGDDASILCQVLAEKIDYSLDIGINTSSLPDSNVQNVSNSMQKPVSGTGSGPWSTAAIHSAVEKEHAGRDMQTGQTVSQTSQQVAAQGLPRV